ncbi:MAG: 5'/3'-nucleotidase SurE [Clostridia bacterium]|nr:5'/3'-nucleotidase SurE [Clostridia bacterium]
MRILVTNDDGIRSPGLSTLVQWARTIGDVTVVAPKEQQSGKSQSIDLINHIEVSRIEYPGVEFAYSVDSTPSDCVRIATRGLHIQSDLVLSGVNHGWNMGADINYSGTCGAIFEASFLGMRAIAFSCNVHSFDPAASNFDYVYRYITENGLFRYNDIYNVNFPDVVKGIRITRQGGHYYEDNFLPSEEKPGHYFADGFCVHENNHDSLVDTDAVVDGYISVTPLSLDRTAHSFHILSEKQSEFAGSDLL